tara:strand:- start:8 stop:436 length:429 start_codon:yes stop_codon:yes gene_type:complete
MFKENFYQNMELWLGLRNQLEVDKNPFDSVFEFWNNVPTSKISIDPYDKLSWPDPWEMILENDYCRFRKILGICYTLQLTECFKNMQTMIHIGVDEKIKDLVYLISVNKKIIIGSYNGEKIRQISNLKNIRIHESFTTKDFH